MKIKEFIKIYNMKQLKLYVCCGLLAFSLMCKAQTTTGGDNIDLSGQWRLALDYNNQGLQNEWYKYYSQWDSMSLPGTTDEAKKGRPESKRKYAYRGYAWYEKEVTIPENWKGKRVVFSIERAKGSMVWFDGQYIGCDSTYICEQKFLLSNEAVPGKHKLTVRIYNGNDKKLLPPVSIGHQSNDGTATNWNGMLGKIQLCAYEDIWVDQVQLYPDIDTKTVKVKCVFDGVTDRQWEGTVRLCANLWNAGSQKHTIPEKTFHVKGVSNTDTVREFIYPMGQDVHLWSEWNPALYKLTMSSELKSGEDVMADHRQLNFGMRKFATNGKQFTINGTPTFLRGKHDGQVFPHQGYAPMNVDEWVKILRLLKDWGINHIRCHTWCPPEACFTACDIVGIYMLPELPHWGSVGRKAKVVQGDVEQKLEVYDNTTTYLIGEGRRLLDQFGNHASFVMFEIGNELGGDRQELQKIITGFRAHDPRKLYAAGSNNFLTRPQQQEGDDYWSSTLTGGKYGAGVYTDCEGYEVRASFPQSKFGHMNNYLRGTDYDFSAGNSHSTIPVIGHETGQYQMYPDTSEIHLYTGVTTLNNFVEYQKRLDKAGLGDLSHKYFKASGALAALCYREEIESALRTKDYGGFQLLDLQDFPGQGCALVGVLNAYFKPKGVISQKEWHQFCSEVVPLLRYPEFTLTNNDTFEGRVQVANYSAKSLSKPVNWSIKDGQGNLIDKGSFGLKDIPQGNVFDIATLRYSLDGINHAQKLNITISIEGTEYENTYSIWVYPADAKIKEGKVQVFTSFNPKAQEALKKGKKVLILPTPEVLPTSVDGAFQSDFWNYNMFKKYGNVGTMGILTDDEHPVFADFPTEYHSNWQWFRLLRNGRPIDMASLPREYRPMVQVIDNFVLNRKLGVLFEAQVGKGKLMVCSMALQDNMKYPEGKQMYRSIMNYMNSKQFNPKQILSVEQIKSIIH